MAIEAIELIKDELQGIYDRIPEIQSCRSNCARCCGPIMWTDAEDIVIRAYCVENGIEYSRPNIKVLIEEDKTCQFLDYDKTCMIYPARPSVCRLFGLSTGHLKCPYIKRQRLSPKQARAIQNEVEKLSQAYYSLILDIRHQMGW